MHELDSDNFRTQEQLKVGIIEYLKVDGSEGVRYQAFADHCISFNLQARRYDQIDNIQVNLESDRILAKQSILRSIEHQVAECELRIENRKWTVRGYNEAYDNINRAIQDYVEWCIPTGAKAEDIKLLYESIMNAGREAVLNSTSDNS